MVRIEPAAEELIPSFYKTLGIVAAERVYIEMIELRPLEEVSSFHKGLIANDGAVVYAVDENRVVGWCDIGPLSSPRLKHRGTLGMGLLPEYRGKGLGQQLMDACLERAKKSGLEKVELTVYTSNLRAIALYKKCGFEVEGLIKHYRKLDGDYFDCIQMAKFL